MYSDTFRLVISIATAVGYSYELYRCSDVEPNLLLDDLYNLSIKKSKVLESTKNIKLLNGKSLVVTRLTSACADNNSNRVTYLLVRGAKACPLEGYSPLVLCCEYGHVEALTALLQHVAVNKFRLSYMRFGSRLETAAKTQYEERPASCDLNVSDSLGRAPIHIAALGGHYRLISILVKFGANINAQMPQGRTALMIACGYDHIRTIVSLLQNGADVRLTDKDAWTCIDYNRSVAVGTSHFGAIQKEEVRQLLLEYMKEESQRRPIGTILKGYF